MKSTFAQGIVFDPPFETDYEVFINDMKCSKIKTCSNGPYYCYVCKHNPMLKHEEDWLPEDCYKQNKNIMKDELIIDGIRYKRVDEELTLEDCVKENNFGVIWDISLPSEYARYPTEAIAEKVLLYGLLQSVAYKLNEGKTGRWGIGYSTIHNQLVFHEGNGSVRFASYELADQAIRIFENSKFDLKKLFQ